MGADDTAPSAPSTDIANESQPDGPSLLSHSTFTSSSFPSQSHRKHTCVLFVLKGKSLLSTSGRGEITYGLVGSWKHEQSSLPLDLLGGPPEGQPGKQEGGSPCSAGECGPGANGGREGNAEGKEIQ